MFIPYGRQYIDEEDIQAVCDVLRSDFLTTGPKVAEFEEAIADYTGAKYAVAVSSGTAALHIACLAAGIGPGDEVITSAITFAASANCVLYCGGRPVFADIDPLTYNIDPADIARKITPRTKALLPVHFTGQPCDMDAIHSIAKEHGLMVIEDASHALGAEYKGRKIGGLSDMSEFSFHPVKHITTGEGGMVTTNDATLYKRLKLFCTHGITRDRSLLEKDEGGWYYEQQELGLNYRLTDLQCALGLSQLKKLPRFLKRRKEIARQYDVAFQDIPGIVTPYQRDGCRNSYHLYVLQFTEKPRKEIYDHLRERGLGVNVHYVPVYKHPYYQRHGYTETCCPNAEALYQNMVSIPMFPSMSQDEVEYVIQAVKEINQL